jgi:hypothetical protein
MKKAATIALMLLLASCMHQGARDNPQKEYAAVLGEDLVFQGLDLLSLLGSPLEEAARSYGVEVHTDDEVGVAFATVYSHPPLPEDWGLKLKEEYPRADFLSPGVADSDAGYSYDMLVHEAGIYLGFYNGYTAGNLEPLIAHSISALRPALDPSSIAEEFMKGSDIVIEFEAGAVRGRIALAHFDGFGLFIIKVTDLGGFFG